MAKTLIIAATEAEIDGLRLTLSDNSDCEFLVTGVGMINTTFAMTKYLSESQIPDRIINVGIAGSFNEEVEIGSVVQVEKDRFSELGAEDHDTFLRADQMDLMTTAELEFESNQKLPELLQTTGITVNTIHGDKRSIDKVKDLYNPDVESMEGAAVAFVAQRFGFDWIQIRSISNHVEPRNKDKWNIALALDSLTEVVTKLVKNSF